MPKTPAGTTTLHYLHESILLVNAAGVPQANTTFVIKDLDGLTITPRDSQTLAVVSPITNASGIFPAVYLPSGGRFAFYVVGTISQDVPCREIPTLSDLASTNSRVAALEGAPVAAGGGGGNVYRIIGTATTYSLTGVPTRTSAPYRDYMGTLDPTTGAYGFDQALDTWNGRPYSYATSSFQPADRAWLDQFDRTTPVDESVYVYDTASPVKPWISKPYAPAPTYVNPSLILNAGDPVPAGFTTGVIFDRPATTATAPAALGEAVSGGTASVAATTNAALAVGDWIVGAVGTNGGTTLPTLGLTTPAGITVVRMVSTGNTASEVALFVGQVTAAQASGITITGTSSATPAAGDEMFVKLIKMSGLSGTASTVADQTATGAGGNVSTLTLTTAAATSQANEYAFACFQFNQGNPVTATRSAIPVGYTEVGSPLASVAGDAAPRMFTMYFKQLNTATTQTAAQSTSATTSTVGVLATVKSA